MKQVHTILDLSYCRKPSIKIRIVTSYAHNQGKDMSLLQKTIY